jgi:hypothetical protein
MQNKTSVNITYFEEKENEEEESPIITNNDEFGTVNELLSKSNNKSSCNLNKLECPVEKPKSINETSKMNTPLTKLGRPHMNVYSIFLEGNDNVSLDNQNKFKKCKLQPKKQNSKMKKYLDVSKKNGKSIFPKISEDIYTQFKSKPNKEVRDINKMEEDAYNKMTSDPYIQTCENRENLKNRKIAKEFLVRKAKEDTFKKIGIECDRNFEMKKLQDPKRAFSVTDRNINFKSTRTLAQFLHDQNQKINRRNKKKKNNKKAVQNKGNILPQDSTYIFSENKNDELYSEFSNDFNIYNFDNISMQYDSESLLQNNDRFKSNDEEEKFINKTFELEKELIKPGVNFSLINNKEEEKKEKNINKEKNKNEDKKKLTNNKNDKKDKNIKESSSTSTSKKSNDNLYKKLINIYKDTIFDSIGKKMENDFDINYSAFLLILYKNGFTNKNYCALLSAENDFNKQSVQSKEISDFSISNSSLSMSLISSNKKINKYKKDSMAGKSLEDEVEKYRNTFKYDKEFQLSIDAWKILTDKQTFDEELSISSKKIFLFYISVLGICKDEKSEKFMRKECPFFFEDKKIIQQFNNINKYIYKYFGLYKMNAMDNLVNPDKKGQIFNNNSNSILSSFTVSNLDNSTNSKKYDMYEKNYGFNYQKNKNNLLDGDTESIRLFNQGIKENQFYNKSIISLTDIDSSDNNSIYLLNHTMTDNSTFSDLKKIFKENPIEKKCEDDSDEIEVDSFLLEDNKNYFQYGPQDKNKNNYSEIKSYIQDDDENDSSGKKTIGKKKIKYVFEIKIEDEPKKLIIRRGDDKNIIIKNFCKKYGLDDIERKKIVEVIEEQLKNLNTKMKKK